MTIMTLIISYLLNQYDDGNFSENERKLIINTFHQMVGNPTCSYTVSGNFK